MTDSRSNSSALAVSSVALMLAAALNLAVFSHEFKDFIKRVSLETIIENSLAGSHQLAVMTVVLPSVNFSIGNKFAESV
jgi:hypothetical protein